MADDKMNPYEYTPLTGNSIRLVKLLPGEPSQDLRIMVEIVDLISYTTAHNDFPRLMEAEELKLTLPPDWWVYSTNDDEIFFYYESAIDPSDWKASWDHPDPTFDSSRYRRPEESPRSDGSHVSYEALSYTWRSEDPEEDAVVECGKGTGHPSSLHLGGNLSCALRHLRHPHTTRTLWIDAICINQSDLQEKEVQIGRMTDIYKSASCVVVWLGTASEDSELAMHTLDYLGQQVLTTKDGWRFCRPESEEPYWCEGNCALSYTNEVWAAINNLLSRPWFTRVWIIQVRRV